MGGWSEKYSPPSERCSDSPLCPRSDTAGSTTRCPMKCAEFVELLYCSWYSTPIGAGVCGAMNTVDPGRAPTLPVKPSACTSMLKSPITNCTGGLCERQNAPSSCMILCRCGPLAPVFLAERCTPAKQQVWP